MGGDKVPGAQAEGRAGGGAGGVQGGKVVTGWCPPAGPQSLAEQTLRTLCLAYKEVDKDAYEQWHQRHQEASLLLQNRAHALHQLYEEMEQNLQVGGAGGGPGTPTPAGSWLPAQSLPCPPPRAPSAAGSHSH